MTLWLKSGDVVFANPSSQHGFGKAARKVINESRATIYRSFNCDEKDTRLFFHSGATEAFVTVLHGMAEKAAKEGRRLLVATSSIDHPAVTSLASMSWGAHVSFMGLKLKADLTYDTETIVKDIREQKLRDPGLLILTHHLWVHNETGIVSPLSELAPLKQIPDLYAHVDAVQAPGKIPDWRDLSLGDFWTFSAHKFGALKGIGFTFYREGINLSALLPGGGQQQGLRGGTENPQGIKSIALALQDLEAVDVRSTQKTKEKLAGFMAQELQGQGSVVEGPLMNSNTIYFYLQRFPSDIALALFDLNGLMISAGSACSSGAARPSAVLTALGKQEVAKNGLRLSLPFTFGEDDLNNLKPRLSTVFNKLKTS